MKVYEFKGFANPARVRIALHEKGLFDEVEFVHVDVPGGEHRTPEFLAKNPSGVVPVLELADGTQISESTAITEYLDHAAGEPTLTGKGAKERAYIHMRQRKIEAGLLEAISHYFHHATEGLGPQNYAHKNKEWGEYQKTVVLKTMKAMDEYLAKNAYLAGGEFSVADITGMAGFAFCDFVKVETPAELTHLNAWKQKVFSRPSASVAA
ncbi:glutathione S-transferase family protein [Rhizobiales bacterium]|uniref:glutathione S-transferase family protein n=1 Tax=Hongsoonwoonella zoysiae TaxID=2821844 RepID=UPI00156057CC|nr:glutathione S-transferase family protein [Hongsoonwoonella zoysiae]NRG16998.1 glutathione S-transferase family protein [Hongsoonwoonella zoysiae]